MNVLQEIFIHTYDVNHITKELISYLNKTPQGRILVDSFIHEKMIGDKHD